MPIVNRGGAGAAAEELARIAALENARNLSDLDDVEALAPGNNHVLEFNVNQSKWVNIANQQGVETTYHSGTISDDEIWDSTTAHVINGDLLLEAKLTILAGTHVDILSNYTVTVGGTSAATKGDLVTKGTPTSPVIIEGHTTGIEVIGNYYYGGCVFRYTEFRNIDLFHFSPRPESYGYYGGAVWVGNCTFVNCGQFKVHGYWSALCFITSCTWIGSLATDAQNIYYSGSLASPKVNHCVCDLGVTSYVPNTLISTSIIRGPNAVITANQIGMTIESCLIENTNSSVSAVCLTIFDYMEIHNCILISESRVSAPLNAADRDHVVFKGNVIVSRSNGQYTISNIGSRWFICGNLFLGAATASISVFNINGTEGTIIEKNSFLAEVGSIISVYATGTTFDTIRNNVFGNSNVVFHSNETATINTLTDNIYYDLAEDLAPGTILDANYTVGTNTNNTTIDPDIRKSDDYSLQEDFGLIVTADIPELVHNLMNKYKGFTDLALTNTIGHATKEVLG